MGLCAGGVREGCRTVVAALAMLAFTVALAGPARANETVFGGELTCVTQPGGVRQCAGPGGPDTNAPADTVPSFDGTPIDINFALPDKSRFGPPYPLAMYFHGFGGEKEPFGGYLKRFTDRGIAALGMTERGFKESCGSEVAIEALDADTPGACDEGFIHLMDSRYEVRDAQYFAGILADEGLIHPQKIGVVGGSYGGGKALALATLKNRVMLPDGSLVPWKSPAGKSMAIAVAAPIVPWSDMAYALAPNGGTLDYASSSPYRKPYGVMKSGIVNGLFATGENFSGSYGAPVDPLFDVIGWKDELAAGEPYGNDPLIATAVGELTRFHSAGYIDDSVTPAPMFIAQGLTDDIFPVDEAIRYYNRIKASHPDARIGLYLADIGHPRALLATQGRPADIQIADARVEEWFAHYLLGDGPEPETTVVARSQVCPYEEPSGGPFTADTWAKLAPGEVRISDPGRHVIEATSGDDGVAAGFISILPGCSQMPDTAEPGTWSRDFPAPGGDGYTVAGSTTVIADISSPNGGESEIAARLLEVTGGQERLIGRALYRPARSGRQVFQLHANVYAIGPDAHLRLQLLPRDGMTGPSAAASYGRPSSDQRDITISDIEVRVPVAEHPGEAG
ncbi:MAG: acetylxylan esterase, partial [Solirubrobacterales bacterium]|nr:acetylxylan esterase [Solirubrobacterales bacterium]